MVILDFGNLVFMGEIFLNIEGDIGLQKGERLTKNQPKIVEWFRKEEGGPRNPHAGGKTGVG